MYFPEVNQQRWLEESRQWLENVDRTHLVLASDKPVLQKPGILSPNYIEDLASLVLKLEPLLTLLCSYLAVGTLKPATKAAPASRVRPPLSTKASENVDDASVSDSSTDDDDFITDKSSSSSSESDDSISDVLKIELSKKSVADDATSSKNVKLMSSSSSSTSNVVSISLDEIQREPVGDDLFADVFDQEEVSFFLPPSPKLSL